MLPLVTFSKTYYQFNRNYDLWESMGIRSASTSLSKVLN